MDTASPINTIAKPYLDIYRYDHAAYFTFESLGKVKAEPEDLVDIAYWALLGKEYEIGLILCNQLAALPGAVSERFARIFSLLLLMNGNHEQANSILSQLLDLGTNPWCSHFLQNSGKDPLGIMAGAAEFDAELIEASVVNMFQSVHFCVKVNCPNCGNHFTTATKFSIFKIILTPCPRCAKPYVVKPSRLADKLDQTTSRADLAELLAIDELCWNWVHNWHAGLPVPESAKCAQSENIMKLVWSDLRSALAEFYLRMFNRQRRNIEHL